MYCKKCGTEQHNGYKFCPKCGTPFTEAKDSIDNSSINSSESLTEEETQNEATEQGHQEEENKADDSLPISPDKEKKVKLTAKAGMWIILIAIVATFIRTGFGFSLWWYIFLLVFAGVALLLWGVLLPNTDADKKPLTTSDASAVKVLFYVGAAMLVILYLWGPLNSDYTSGGDYKYERSSNDSSNDIPKWLTEWKFVSERENITMVLKFFKKGEVLMGVSANESLRAMYPGMDGDLTFNGTYTVEGNNVHIYFTGENAELFFKRKDCIMKMDNNNQRLYTSSGVVFMQSI